MISGTDVLDILSTLEGAGLSVWLDGGWGVDALLREQTRPHDDLDLVVRLEDADGAISVLATIGFSPDVDARPTRFVVGDEGDRRIDFHPVVFDEDGSARQIGAGTRRRRRVPGGWLRRRGASRRPRRCLSHARAARKTPPGVQASSQGPPQRGIAVRAILDTSAAGVPVSGACEPPLPKLVDGWKPSAEIRPAEGEFPLDPSTSSPAIVTRCHRPQKRR